MKGDRRAVVADRSTNLPLPAEPPSSLVLGGSKFAALARHRTELLVKTSSRS